jgi:hypothetical protein
MNSKLIGAHIPECWAAELMKDKKAPTEWNLLEIIKVHCDKEGNDADAETIGGTETWLEIKCGDKKCTAKKRIRAIAMANI